jgi:hypothetical protein
MLVAQGSAGPNEPFMSPLMILARPYGRRWRRSVAWQTSFHLDAATLQTAQLGRALNNSPHFTRDFRKRWRQLREAWGTRTNPPQLFPCRRCPRERSIRWLDGRRRRSKVPVFQSAMRIDTTLLLNCEWMCRVSQEEIWAGSRTG